MLLIWNPLIIIFVQRFIFIICNYCIIFIWSCISLINSIINLIVSRHCISSWIFWPMLLHTSSNSILNIIIKINYQSKWFISFLIFFIRNMCDLISCTDIFCMHTLNLDRAYSFNNISTMLLKDKFICRCYKSITIKIYTT